MIIGGVGNKLMYGIGSNDSFIIDGRIFQLNNINKITNKNNNPLWSNWCE
jgi:hypothetical protein